MTLSIIIVSWNIKDKLRENLIALLASRSGFDFEIIVADNDSADGTAEMVKTEFPEVRLIANRENLGFAKANNQGIKLAKGEYVLLLNPDMRVRPDTLGNIVNWMNEHKEAWLSGCRLVSEDGEIVKHVRRFPRLCDQLAIVLKIPHFWPGILDEYLRTDFDYSQAAAVDSVRGGFFMLRRSTIEKVGMLDERYFLWFEEVDYCKRVKEAGGEVWYTPAAECVDHVGQSFKQVARMTTQGYFRDSMLKYFQKWHPAWQYWLLSFAWMLGLLIARLMILANVKSRAKT